MTSKTAARSVHLVGSLPLESSAAVFQTVGAALRTHAKRIPDGETGPRRLFVAYQAERFRSVRGLEVVQELTMLEGTAFVFKWPFFALAAGVRGKELEFGPLGYAASAAASYSDFVRARRDGAIAPKTRFQVSLPTPVGVMAVFTVASSFREILAAYENAFLVELVKITGEIPHEDLAIQWDLALETEVSESLDWLAAMLPPAYEVAKNLSRQEMMDSVGRLINSIPEEVEVGLHCCYGDFLGKHVVEPKDGAVMTDLVNRLTDRLGRPLNYIHMPVPIARDDAEYFAPFKQLRLSPDTEVYLGLLHLQDGVEGARRRIAAAQRVFSTFGIATECGLGRIPLEQLPSLLTLHRDVAQTC